MSADRAGRTGVIDTLCNAFTPDRRRVWDGALEASGVQVKIRRDDSDSFAEPEAMVDRMDKLGVATLLLITADLGTTAGSTRSTSSTSSPDGKRPRSW